MTFTDQLVDMFTMMCQQKNCPLTVLNSSSKAFPKSYDSVLICPFPSERGCCDVTLDDWDGVLNPKDKEECQ